MRRGASASTSCRATPSPGRNRCRLLPSLLAQIARRDSFACGLLRFELSRRSVHAVAHTGGLRAVEEDVAEVTAAARAMDLRPFHQVSVVFACGHRPVDRLEEARPAGAAFKLRLRLIERLAAAG